MNEEATPEEELRANVRRARQEADLLAAHSGTVYWQVNAQGLYTDVGSACLKVWGYRPEELVGSKHFYDLHPEAGREEFKQAAFAAFAEKAPFTDLRNPLTTGDGRLIWVLTNGTPVLDADGHLLGYYGTDTDITEHKKLETARIESEARFRSYFELPLHGTCITSIEKCWLEVNARLCEILGYSLQEIVKMTWAEMTHSDDLAADEAQFARVLSGEIEQYRLEKRFIRKDGSMVWTEISVGCVRRADGRVGYIVCVIEDISDRKGLEANLLHALDKAESANRAKSEFLAVMSHELRTPLDGVLGFAEMLSGTALDTEQREFVRIISDSSSRLLSVIQNILDFSSIEKGGTILESAPVLVADLMHRACQAASQGASAKGLEFRCEAAPEAPGQVVGDACLISQILSKLLDNAVKFTAKGSVVLRIAPGMADGRSSLDFAVVDTGKGIAHGTLAHLFKPFTQADTSFHRPFEGAGLGLAIAQRLAEVMGGSITADSTPSQGSTFTFHLPWEPEEFFHQ